MAMSYNLALARQVSPSSVLTDIKQLVGGTMIDAGQLLVVPELIVGASAVDDPNLQELYREEWGIDMLTSVGFALSNKTEPELQYAAAGLMSIAAAGLAAQLDTDAGLIYQHEKKLMRRQDGVLYLYQWWPQWNEPAVRPRLPGPYELTPDDPIA